MITFGLTGGIAMGKSTVTKTFLRHGIPMVDADIVARQVVEPGTRGLKEIVQYFGSNILSPDGSLDRGVLGEIVFNHPDLSLRQDRMNALNKIMAPLIQEESSAQIKKLHVQGHPICGYDAALLCEMGNANKYRPLLVVSCTPEQQLARLMKRGTGRGPLTQEQAMNIIRVQMPVEEKIKLADYIIDTAGTIEHSILQTEAIIRSFKNF